MMTISELIELLEEIKEVEGDIGVSVQYRDDSGEYLGEEEPMLEVREDEHYSQHVIKTIGNMTERHVERCSGKRVML